MPASVPVYPRAACFQMKPTMLQPAAPRLQTQYLNRRHHNRASVTHAVNQRYLSTTLASAQRPQRPQSPHHRHQQGQQRAWQPQPSQHQYQQWPARHDQQPFPRQPQPHPHPHPNPHPYPQPHPQQLPPRNRVQLSQPQKKYVGVSPYIPPHGRRVEWQAQIQIGDHHVNLGRFIRQEDGARAYDAAGYLKSGTKGVKNFSGDYAGLSKWSGNMKAERRLALPTINGFPEPTSALEKVRNALANPKRLRTSRFLNVRLDGDGFWRAEFKVANLLHFIGTYVMEEHAARAHTAACYLRDGAIRLLRGKVLPFSEDYIGLRPEEGFARARDILGLHAFRRVQCVLRDYMPCGPHGPHGSHGPDRSPRSVA